MKLVIGLIAGLFLSTAAIAADMPTKVAAVSVSSPADLFSGWWVGAGVGYAWGNVNPDLPINDFKPNGVVAGGSLGYRSQIMPKVYLGVDGTFNYAADVNDNQSFGSVTAKVKNNWYGTAGLSLGYAVMPDLLVSGTAGVAYGRHTATIGFPGGSIDAKDTQAGWYVGASADYSLGSLGLKGWTAGLDYKHISYGSANFGFPIIAGITIGTKADIRDDVIMLTAKYKFGL